MKRNEERKMNTNNMNEIIERLQNVFAELNNHYYNGELPTPVITVQRAPRASILGWCTRQRTWENSAKETFYEINIVSQNLNRGTEGIVETMLHEMAHLYAKMKKIDDCSIQQYHRKSFKKIADAHGLVTEFWDNNHGFAVTKLTDEAKELCKKFDLDFDLVNVVGSIEEPKKPKKTKKPSQKINPKVAKLLKGKESYIYATASGEVIISTNPDLDVVCQKTGEKFERVEMN